MDQLNRRIGKTEYQLLVVGRPIKGYDLQKVERTVYNNLGVSQNLFNTEGNMALEKSILNDEATMRDLVLQFQNLLNRVIRKFNRPNHYSFQASVLETTIYNYK